MSRLSGWGSGPMGHGTAGQLLINGRPVGGGMAPTPTVGARRGGQNPAGQIGDHLRGLQQQSNTANEERFQKLMDLAGQFGATQQRQNQQLTQQQLGATQQGLISRGLGNSTVADTMRQGILRQGQDQSAAIGERQAMMQMQPLMARQDQQPNLGMYAQLLSQPGAMQGMNQQLLQALFGIR